MTAAGAAVEDKQTSGNDYIDRSAGRIESADGWCSALDLSGSDRLDGAEPVESITDIDESILSVSAEVLASDGQQSTSIITTSGRCD